MRRHPFSRFTRPLVLLAVVIAYGTVGYWLLGGWSVLEALFMTVITIPTVGYEEVPPLDARGEAFSISLIVFGVIGFLYTFGVIVEVLGSGRWQEDWSDKSMQEHVAR